MSAPGKDDRRPPVPRPVAPPRGLSGTPQPRPPSNTHSLLPSRSSGLARGGMPKMVFRPVRPPRREIKPDPDGPPAAPLIPASSLGPASAGPSRPPPRPRKPITMTASGPFALGSGSTRVRNAGKSFAPPSQPIPRPKQESSINVESSHRLDYREPDKADRKEREEYSDPESPGVEIIDMEDVNQLDPMAPTSLPRMKKKERKRKKKTEDAVKVKRETPGTREDGVDVEDGGIELEDVEKEEAPGNADALDLSASEDEEVMDNLMDDFVGDVDDDEKDPENRLYLFQFPPLFPDFQPSGSGSQQQHVLPRKRSVAFAEGTAGGSGTAGESPAASSCEVKVKADASLAESSAGKRHEGQIGRLDVYADGRVNFRFNDIVMELTGGSQSSFLQHVMILDGDQQKATTLGELHRKFVVSPEIESMLNDVDIAHA